MEVEQLSFFSMLAAPTLPQVAVCCPGGEYVVQVAGHSLVLRPANCPADDVPAGHRYYHYTIGERLFSGVFVGRERART